MSHQDTLTPPEFAVLKLLTSQPGRAQAPLETGTVLHPLMTRAHNRPTQQSPGKPLRAGRADYYWLTAQMCAAERLNKPPVHAF